MSGKIFLQATAIAPKVLGVTKNPKVQEFKSHFPGKEKEDKLIPLIPRFSPTAPGALVLYKADGPVDKKYEFSEIFFISLCFYHLVFVNEFYFFTINCQFLLFSLPKMFSII